MELIDVISLAEMTNDSSLENVFGYDIYQTIIEYIENISLDSLCYLKTFVYALVLHLVPNFYITELYGDEC